MTDLRVSKDLALPVNAATQTILIVGKRGSGKSTTAARIVEQLLKAKVPVAILDPVDSWWGLKAARDGVGKGYGVYVFGGRHKDLDLEPAAGAMIAEFLCEHRAPLVLSCKHMSGLERSRLMVDFALTLFRKWTGGVLHLVLEEAHELAPQAPPKGEKAEEMLGAFKRLWKLGRSSGIGGTAITQRPASLHKDITTQSEILVVHRTIGPQDVEAVRQWIKYHHQGEEILPQLATLKTGEAFVWAPEFPEDDPIGLRRVQVLPRETFDSSSTPKVGEQRSEPKELAPVDLERLRSKMAATIERQKAEDPRELRKKISEQAARIRTLEAAKPAPPTAAPKRVEVPTLKDAQIKRLEALVVQAREASAGTVAYAKDRYERALTTQTAVLTKADEILAALRAAQNRTPELGKAVAVGAGRHPAFSDAARSAPVVHRAPVAARREAAGNGDGRQPPARQKILDALAWLEGVGITSAERTQLALLADASPTSSAYANNLGGLRSAGLIEYSGPGQVVLTGEGRDQARADDAPSTSDELQKAILAKLTPAKARILEELIDAYPNGVERAELAEKAGASATSSAYANNLGSLRSLGLIDYRQGAVVAKPVLFLDGAA